MPKVAHLDSRDKLDNLWLGFRTRLPAVIPYSWLEKIIKIDTRTDQSNKALLDFLLPLLKRFDFHTSVTRHQEKGQAFYNVVASTLPHKPTGVFFHTHCDTVPPGDCALWTRCKGNNPFRLTRTGTRLYGLGSADVKLDLLCKVWALKNFVGQAPFSLVVAYGEERGLVGAKHVIQTLRKRKDSMALVGEPSQMVPIYAHKGHAVFTLWVPDQGLRSKAHPLSLETSLYEKEHTFMGKSAHSATPQLGRNAIMLALEFLRKEKRSVVRLVGGDASNKIPAQCTLVSRGESNAFTQRLLGLTATMALWAKQLGNHHDCRFTPSYVTCSLNRVETAERGLILTYDMRLLPRTSTRHLYQKLQEKTQKWGCKIRSWEVDPPLDGKRESRLCRLTAKSLKLLGLKPRLATKPTSTEAALYAQAGISSLVIGPGKSVGNVHRPNEYQEWQELHKAVLFYDMFAAQWLAEENRHG